MRSAPLSSDFFSRNRTRLLELLPGDSIAVLCSNPQMPRNGDQFYPYRQHSDFFYLSGITQQGSFLVLSRRRTTLFLKKADPKTLLWSGPLHSREEAVRLSGIEEVRCISELDAFLETEYRYAGYMFVNHLEGFKLCVEMEKLLLGRERASLQPLMTKLRMIKQAEEIEEIQKSCAITRSAFLRVAGTLRPGMREFEVEAEIAAEFIRRGARGHAFEPIVASGSNALVLHYVENDGSCRDGDLVLMDFGSELNNYAADCSRTLPVNGKFSSRQRALYDAVHRVFIKARELMVPGTVLGEFQKQVGELWQEEHIALGLYSRAEARRQSGSNPLWKKYFMHGISHSMGLDVHDPFDRSNPFAPGMVITCEPGIYIEKEGIGIRLENDILITGEGPVDLMADIPMEAGEIEDLMQSSRRDG